MTTGRTEGVRFLYHQKVLHSRLTRDKARNWLGLILLICLGAWPMKAALSQHILEEPEKHADLMENLLRRFESLPDLTDSFRSNYAINARLTTAAAISRMTREQSKPFRVAVAYRHLVTLPSGEQVGAAIWHLIDPGHSAGLLWWKKPCAVELSETELYNLRLGIKTSKEVERFLLRLPQTL